MNTLNDHLLNLCSRTRVFINTLQNDRGSEVAEAAGVALLSAVVVGAILGLRGTFSSAIQAAFNQLVSKLH